MNLFIRAPWHNDSLAELPSFRSTPSKSERPNRHRPTDRPNDQLTTPNRPEEPRALTSARQDTRTSQTQPTSPPTQHPAPPPSTHTTPCKTPPQNARPSRRGHPPTIAPCQFSVTVYEWGSQTRSQIVSLRAVPRPRGFSCQV